MKLYNIMHNVGKVKYLVNYHDGVQKNKDGSVFFGVRCFSNKKKFKDFQKELLKENYVYGSSDFKITDENIHLYYKSFNDEDLKKYMVKLGFIFNSRFTILKSTLFKVESEIKRNYCVRTNLNGYILGQTFFDLKDNLQPLDEYIKEIKDSNDYKQYRFNYLVETYDLSISHLKRLEHELFADDSSYKSNIDNLIYAALDNIADDFKMNVINYIEDNYLQEKTGISCISDIPVIIKDGEFQGLFKEFESYGLNDFSVQNISMFIDRYREIKALDENKTCIEKAL